MADRERDWAERMRRARAGDAAAYDALLREIAVVVRAGARRRLARYGFSAADAEDVVQETLVAIHLKQDTWDEARPFLPWLAAVARHKATDAARRLGRRRRMVVDVPVEDWADLLPAADPDPDRALVDLDRCLSRLPERQRAVVRALAIEGGAIPEVAARLSTSEGAVRVAFHRALRTLARALAAPGRGRG